MPAPPFAHVDHLVIAVRDLDAGIDAYAAMLGREPSWRGHHPDYGTANALFALRNCYLELLACDGGPLNDHPVAATLRAYLERRGEGLFAIALGSNDLDASHAALVGRGLAPSPILPGEGRAADGRVRRWRSFLLDRAETRGIAVIAIQHDPASTLPAAAARGDARSVVDAVDHVVLFSDDVPRALDLWTGTFGVPERWRREFPERGTLNVGLRLGGVTLELVGPLTGAGDGRGERPWGVAYVVPDVDAAVARLRNVGTSVGDVRDGIAPRTRVATVKWSERLPTLLIEHASRRAQV